MEVSSERKSWGDPNAGWFSSWKIPEMDDTWGGITPMETSICFHPSGSGAFSKEVDFTKETIDH